VNALARLHVNYLTRKGSLKAGSKQEKRRGEERRNARSFVWLFGTGNKQWRRHARAYPEQEREVV